MRTYSYHRHIHGLLLALLTLLSCQTWAQSPRFKVDAWQGAPTLFREGQPTAPMFLFEQQVSAPGCNAFNPDPNGQTFDGEDFASAGFDYYSSIERDHYLDLGWSYSAATGSQFDLALFKKVLPAFAQSNPRGYLIPRIHLWAPPEWLSAHPDDIVQYGIVPPDVVPSYHADGDMVCPKVSCDPGHTAGCADACVNDSAAGGYRCIKKDCTESEMVPQYAIVESFASESWKAEVSTGLRQLVAYIQSSPYADRIMGIHLAAGLYGEWHAFSADYIPDRSPAMLAYFRGFLTNRYHTDAALQAAWKAGPSLTLGNATIPTATEIRTPAAGYLQFSDSSNPRVRDYYEAYHDSVVKAIDTFSQVVKDASKDSVRGPLLVAALYGYEADTAELSQSMRHGNPAAAYRLPNVDAFASPHSYKDRSLGQGGELRSYVQSIQAQGKIFIDEADERTYLAALNPAACEPVSKVVDEAVPAKYARDQPQSLSVLQRAFTNVVTQGAGMWYMDQSSGQWYADPVLKEQFSTIKKFAEYSMNISRSRRSEVVVLSCPQAEFSLTTDRDLTAQFHATMIPQLKAAGAPFDRYLIDDLTMNLVPDYKVYFVLDCLYLTSAQQAALNGLKRDGHTLVWFFAPGFATPSGLSLSNMHDLTGIDFAPLTTTDGQFTSLCRSAPTSPVDPSCAQDPQYHMYDVHEFGKEAPSFLSPVFHPISTGQEVWANYTCGNPADPAVVKVSEESGKWVSIYSAMGFMPSDLIARVYKQAGVHVYVESCDPISVSDKWLGIHGAADNPMKTINLSQPSPVYDVFKGTLISESTQSFQYTVNHGDTALFLLDNPLKTLSDRGGWNTGNRFLTMDADGDGVEDLVVRYADGAMAAYKFDGQRLLYMGGGATPFSDSGGWNQPNRFFAMRIDDDLKDELVVRYASGGMAVWNWSTTNNRFEWTRDFPTPTPFSDNGIWDQENHFLLMDIDNSDGKGKKELIARDGATGSDGVMSVWISNGTVLQNSHTAFATPFTDAGGWNQHNRFFVMNVIDDTSHPLDELVVRYADGGMATWGWSANQNQLTWKQDIPSTSGVFNDQNWSDGNRFLVMDVNGDGRDELITRAMNGSHVVHRAMTSTGGGLNAYLPDFYSLYMDDVWLQGNRFFVLKSKKAGQPSAFLARYPTGVFDVVHSEGGAQLAYHGNTSP